MKLSLSLPLFTAASLHAAEARIGGHGNPLEDAMDALLNEERFLQGHRLYRLMQDDDSDDDAACEAEMGECFLPLTARSFCPLR